MADRIRAADLPAGSVVAARADAEPETGRAIYSPSGALTILFHRMNDGTLRAYPWVTADLPSRINLDSEVQRALDGGAVVLRYGDGRQQIGERGQVATIETGAGVTVTAYRSTTRQGGITVEVDAASAAVDRLVVNVNDNQMYPAKEG